MRNPSPLSFRRFICFCVATFMACSHFLFVCACTSYVHIQKILTTHDLPCDVTSQIDLPPRNTSQHTAAPRRARLTEQAFNCNIWNVQQYNARHNVLHCFAFAKLSTEQNNQLAIVRHCTAFAKLSTEQNNAIPIVLLGAQLFCICQMPYRAEQCRTMQSRLLYSVRLGSFLANSEQ